MTGMIAMLHCYQSGIWWLTLHEFYLHLTSCSVYGISFTPNIQLASTPLSDLQCIIYYRGLYQFHHVFHDQLLAARVGCMHGNLTLHPEFHCTSCITNVKAGSRNQRLIT